MYTSAAEEEKNMYTLLLPECTCLSSIQIETMAGILEG